MLEIRDKSLCNGCKLCSAVCPVAAIIYEIDQAGFWYPKIDKKKCVNCGKCETNCPQLNQYQSCFDMSMLKVYAAWSLDDKVRLDSTSGGLFYELARQLIIMGGVVYACAYSEDYKSASHIRVSSLEELYKLLGSKHLQSDMGHVYVDIKNDLDSGREVMFCGSPCQSVAIDKFLEKQYPNLIRCDFICNSIYSPKAHKKYVEYLEKKYNAPIIFLRAKDKRYGWNYFGNSAIFQNGKKYFADRNDDLRVVSYHKGHLFVRDSCFSCKFKSLPRLSDITLADFWGIDQIRSYPGLEKGVSAVLVNSEKGKWLFNLIHGRIEFYEHSIDEVLSGNKALLYSAVPGHNRDEAVKHLDDMPFEKLVNKYKTKQDFVREFCSLIKRRAIMIARRVLK